MDSRVFRVHPPVVTTTLSANAEVPSAKDRQKVPSPAGGDILSTLLPHIVLTPQPSGKALERSYDLHRILACRKHAFVVLHHETDPFGLEPAHDGLIVERAECAAHHPVPSRINLGKPLHAPEGIGQVAPPSSGHRQLRERTARGLEHQHFRFRMPPLCLYGTEAPRSTGSDHGEHLAPSAIVYSSHDRKSSTRERDTNISSPGFWPRSRRRRPFR